MFIHSINKKINNNTFSVHHWLLFSCAFSCALVLARVMITGYNTYLFLIWNLILAYIPYAITSWLTGKINVLENKVKLIAVLFAWLLFIPNAFYIITDLFHLDEFDAAPRWFDLLLIFSFAWNGLLLGMLSLRKVELIIQVISGRHFSLFMVLAVMWLNAFGIYIGRYLRYNSWDIIMQPFSLFGEMLEILMHPLHNKLEWGMIGVYTLFMTVVYFTLKKMNEQSLINK
jgi:uncharacterized membrane protein